MTPGRSPTRSARRSGVAGPPRPRTAAPAAVQRRLRSAPYPPASVSVPFICPHCGRRTLQRTHEQLFTGEPHACGACGHPFLFELTEDYFPAPDAAFFTLDAAGHVIGVGRGAFEMTGLRTERVIGQRAGDVLGLDFEDGTDHVGVALEYGARVEGKPVSVRGLRAGERVSRHRATADLLPAYPNSQSDDGGLLLVLTPSK